MIKTHETFLKELVLKNEHYRNKEFELVGEYKNNREKVLLENEFGLMSMNAWTMLTNNRPSISNALNKTEYYKNYLHKFNSFYRDGFFKIVGEFKTMNDRIQVETKYGICESKAQSFINHIPSIETAINKTQYFINQSNEIHNYKYDYSDTIYVHSNTKVKIKCPYHNIFEQKPNAHKSKQGCPKCKVENSFRKSDWVKGDKKGTLYLIHLEGNGEEFYKIGITKNNLVKRYSGSNKFTYTYSIIKLIISDDKSLIWDSEKQLKKLLKDYNYLPINEFAGSKTECFVLSNKVQELFKQLEGQITEKTNYKHRDKYE